MEHILAWGCLQQIHLGIRIEKATNVLGVCSQDMQFIYVLADWEGSAADGRVLHKALRKTNGLNIPNGKSCTRSK